MHGRLPFKKVLIANRGEIAVRVARGVRELGAIPVAIYSEADRDALHVRVAGEAYPVGPPPSRESYLNIERVLDAAKKSKADAIHPGYGFLSENATFAQAVVDAGIVWVGPPPKAIAAMGSKTGARDLVRAAGVPVVPGTPGPTDSLEEVRSVAKTFGYPILIKAAGGGGGKGMRRVDREEDLEAGFRMAKSEAKSAFNNDTVYVEKYLREPRHIEIQVLADKHGKTVTLFERECSIQRRHQKVIEECPSVAIDEPTRQKMCAVAIAAAKSVGYESAGTCEFLYDAEKNFYFLEMNTRLQVEHPVTEAVTGVDLVKAMLRIAAGEKLELEQDQIARRGHAIECRIYAEDPERNFMPSPGKITAYREPSGPGVRVDGGVYEGYEVPVHYDPMIAKLVTFGLSRGAAINRMIRALGEYKIHGIKTAIPLYLKIMKDPDFVAGNISTHFLTPEFLQGPYKGMVDGKLAMLAAAVAAFERDRDARALPGSPAEDAESASTRDAGAAWRLSAREAGRRGGWS
jgi:acetyl-CoA carboxylase biotin carboxylase subunit